MKRRLFVASLSASSLVACGPVKDQLTTSLHGVLDSAQVLNHAVIGTRGDARLYTEADIDKVFRVNGLDTPSDVRYADAARDDFGAYRLPVAGLVEPGRQLGGGVDQGLGSGRDHRAEGSAHHLRAPTTPAALTGLTPPP